MDLIKQLTDNISGDLKTYLFPMIPFLIVTIKIAIDNWGMTDLEKLKLSNFKKFQIELSKYIFFSILFLGLVGLLLYIYKINNEKFIFGIIAISFIFYMSFIFMMEKSIKLIDYLLSFKYSYYIVNENDIPIYRIIKSSNNNLLLVESNGIEEFIDARISRRYKKIYGENKNLRNFYNSNKIKVYIWVILALCLLIPILLKFTTPWVQFVVYIIYLLLIIVFLNLVFNYLDNKRFNKEKQIKKQKVGE